MQHLIQHQQERQADWLREQAADAQVRRLSSSRATFVRRIFRPAGFLLLRTGQALLQYSEAQN
jgi:hypothetical protein